jgi:transcription elongation factor Elf1
MTLKTKWIDKLREPTSLSGIISVATLILGLSLAGLVVETCGSRYDERIEQQRTRIDEISNEMDKLREARRKDESAADKRRGAIEAREEETAAELAETEREREEIEHDIQQKRDILELD